jgi:excisionase family DNA binding protein
MTVRQVASYLQVNEKKIYSLVREGKIPASKLTGKWLFPRDLVDQWLLESSHGGLLTDRIVVAGSDDPLLFRAITQVANALQSQALISYTATGSQLGLSLLAHRRADVCGIHWGPAEESLQRHPALVRQFVQSGDWALVRLFRREQGLLVSPGLWSAQMGVEEFFHPPVRWIERQEGAGSQRFLRELVARHDLDPADRRITGRASTEREAASMIAMGQAEVGPGVRAAATEFGLRQRLSPLGEHARGLRPCGTRYARLDRQRLIRAQCLSDYSTLISCSMTCSSPIPGTLSVIVALSGSLPGS